MKKYWIYMFLLMAIIAMPFTACSNDDDEFKAEEENLHNPESDEDQTEVLAYDALEWLQGCLAVVDENGEVVRRIYGTPLDASLPTVLSVAVSDLAMAEKTFLGWVAPGKEATKVEGGYDYNLTDAEGQAQGSVSFRAVAGQAGVLAHMTVAKGTGLKQVSEVKFIDAENWPENAVVPRYYSGKTYKFKDEVYRWKVIYEPGTSVSHELQITKKDCEFFCIQGNGDGKEAILVWLCPDTEEEKKGSIYIAYRHPKPRHYIRDEVYKRLPTVAETQKVLDFYLANYETWQYMLKVMDDRGYQWSAYPSLTKITTGNSEFLLNSYDEKNNKIKCLDLDSKKGEICDVSVSSCFNYRYMHIRIFPPATN